MEASDSTIHNYRSRIRKGWTSIEESRMLIKMGIDVRTADLYYDAGDIETRNGLHSFTEGWEEATLHNGIPRYVPAWSVGTLLSMLPSDIRVYPASMKDPDAETGYIVESVRTHNISICDDIVGAAVKATIWTLTETSLLKNITTSYSSINYPSKNFRIINNPLVNKK